MSSSEVSFASSLWSAALMAAPILLYRPVTASICERRLEFYVIVLWLIMAYFPYLSKPSKYYSATASGIAVRPLSDYLVTTCFVYFLPAIYATLVSEYHMAFLCLVTCWGSSTYHRNREAAYFNVDNIFATSVLVTYCWSLYLSYGTFDEYFTFGLIGIPVAIFLLVYCGMPADITFTGGDKFSPLCCVRSDRDLYNSVHALWHVASACGPILSVWLFSTLSKEHVIRNNAGSDPNYMVMGTTITVAGYPGLPIVPIVAIAAGVLLNVTGNILGVMPLE